MSSEYRNNHYVPVWYQKRFLPPTTNSNELFYLDLKSGTFTDGRGVIHNRRAVKRTGPRRCFAEDDLYTTRFGGVESKELERLLFGVVDTKGRAAVEYFGAFQHPSADRDAFNDLLHYMTIQRLRTPKGLGWLSQQARTQHDDTLKLMVRLQRINAALWAECVWLIADVSNT
jgi:hypothetical protein